ncbi:MAG TPA: response regulator [Bryobacteraceae bacterium]|nr:response regulator [Bryobacteraceae bacterium]
MFSSCHVLIVISDSLQCQKIEETLRRLGLHSSTCASLLDARASIQQQAFQFVLCSDDLPDCNLRTAVSVLTAATGGVPVIVLSHLADWDAYMKALGAGAFDYIACPPDPAEMERIVRNALEQNPPPRRASHTAA